MKIRIINWKEADKVIGKILDNIPSGGIIHTGTHDDDWLDYKTGKYEIGSTIKKKIFYDQFDHQYICNVKVKDIFIALQCNIDDEDDVELFRSKNWKFAALEIYCTTMLYDYSSRRNRKYLINSCIWLSEEEFMEYKMLSDCNIIK